MTTAGGLRVWAPEPTPAGYAAFAERAVPFLARDEGQNNLALGILDHLLGGRYPGAILATAQGADGGLHGLLMRTPPHGLIVPAGCAPGAVETLLAWWRGADPDAPGMVGPLPQVEEAAAVWARLSAAAGRPIAVRRLMHQGVYRLDAVRPTGRPRPAARAAGRARLATAADRERVVPWLAAFEVEAVHRETADGEAAFAAFVDHPVRRLYLWETPAGEVVALTGRSGRTPSGVRIGPVYTPPEQRGRGYGEALVAAVSQLELDEGARACFLYTDLDYGASNRLYLRVGYEKIGESADLRFVGVGG
jgi:GNAT superfamily N-acetyltransferase